MRCLRIAGLKFPWAGLSPSRANSPLVTSWKAITLPAWAAWCRTNYLVVDIHATISSAGFKSPSGSLNPGGRALVVFERVPYTSNPSASTSGSDSYIFGDSFRAFPNITHPFTPLPKTINLDSAGTEKFLTSLQLFRRAPSTPSMA